MRTGLILAGGSSRRMGRDKATLEVGGSPLLARVARGLREAGAETIVVAGGSPERAATYRALAGPPARFVADDLPDAGPVAGLAAGLAVAEGPTLVAPVDAPALAPAAYAPLLASLPGHAAAAWASAKGSRGGVAWLFAVFDPAKAVPAFEAALARGVREVAEAARDLDAAILDESSLLALPGGGRHLDNWNAPGDLVGDP